mgnify:CR=1 FL=1
MDYEEIKKLIDDMGNAKIDELEIEFPEGMKISMKKNTEKEVIISNERQVQANTIPAVSMETINSQNNSNNLETIINKSTNRENTQEENYKIIKSPMVGTFYSRPAPNKDAFTKAGDTVKKGQVICIVEAMKLMNEIESEFDGEIAEICVKDGDVVEYGTPLFKVK